jgi:peptide deformylase
MKEIIQKENPILRKRASEIPSAEIVSASTAQLLRDMKEALAAEEDGVALAAPQISVLKRVFIVSGKAFLESDASKSGPIPTDTVFINPRIIKLSKHKEEMDEGCLSVKTWYGKVERPDKARIEAYDEKGVKFERGGSGLLAQIFQHEMDHLEGKLFTDKASDLRQVPQDIDDKEE